MKSLSKAPKSPSEQFIEYHNYIKYFEELNQGLFYKDTLMEIENPPDGYNDDIKDIILALHISGICKKGDETDHIGHIERSLQNGLNPKDLPKLYLDTIKNAEGRVFYKIWDQCKDSVYYQEIGHCLEAVDKR